MFRKQGIIHLGYSKSPGFRNSKSKNKFMQHSQKLKTQRTDQRLVENIHLNNSMHVSPSPPVMKVVNKNLFNTHSGIFLPSPRQVQQILVVKQNIKPMQINTLLQQSPIKRVVVSRPISSIVQNSPNKLKHSLQIQAQTSQHEGLLLRKIKLLERRIQQLHQDKQVCLVKSHEQKKKLAYQNNILRNKLLQIQNIKNSQIINLKQQITNLKVQSNSQRIAQAQPISKPNIFIQKQYSIRMIQAKQCSQLSHKSLKNDAYTQQQQQQQTQITNKNYKNQDNIEISQDQYQILDNKYKTLQIQNINLNTKIECLQKQNYRLAEELRQVKQQLLQDSGIIEENNNKIVKIYENRINDLNGQINKYKQQTNKFSYLKDSLQFANKQNQEYVQRLNIKSQQSTKIQTMYKQRISHMQLELNNYCQSLKKAQHKLHILQQKLSQNQQAYYKLKQQNSQIQSTASIRDKEKQVTQQSLTQSCQKCKQLIKTLVKLNQKVFFKTC